MARTRTTTWTRRESFHGHDLETDCTVDYTVSGKHVPMRWGPDGGSPAEWPEVDLGDVRVEATGEILTDLSDAEERDIVDRIDLSDEDEDEAEDAAEAAQNRMLAKSLTALRRKP